MLCSLLFQLEEEVISQLALVISFSLIAGTHSYHLTQLHYGCSQELNVFPVHYG